MQEISICPAHLNSINQCFTCSQMNLMTEADCELKQTLIDSMEVVPVYDIDNPKRLYQFEFEYVIDGDREQVFHPRNSNYTEALRSSDRVVDKIKRTYPHLLPSYHQTFVEHEEAGYLKRLTYEEIASLRYKPHCYLAHNLVLNIHSCLLYTSPSPRDATLSRMPSSA